MAETDPSEEVAPKSEKLAAEQKAKPAAAKKPAPELKPFVDVFQNGFFFYGGLEHIWVEG